MEQENVSPHGGDGHKPTQRQEQQQPQPHEEHAAGQGSDGHAGQGSESAMKQMQAWEQRRSVVSGGKRRNGPG